jgi:hypothetical protein
MSHVHQWADAEVGCEDCGSHHAVRCTDENCPDDYDWYPIDLVFNDDPRTAGLGDTQHDR